MESRYADHRDVDGQCVSDITGPGRCWSWDMLAGHCLIGTYPHWPSGCPRNDPTGFVGVLGELLGVSGWNLMSWQVGAADAAWRWVGFVSLCGPQAR